MKNIALMLLTVYSIGAGLCLHRSEEERLRAIEILEIQTGLMVEHYHDCAFVSKDDIERGVCKCDVKKRRR